MIEIYCLFIVIVSIGMYMLWVVVLFFKYWKKNNYVVLGEEIFVVYVS